MAPYVVYFEYDNGANISVLKTTVYTSSIKKVQTLLNKKYVKDSDSSLRIIRIYKMKPDEVL